MLKLNIANLLKAKGHDEAGSWLKKHGITHNSAYKLTGNRMDHIRLPHIDIIAFDAWCTPNDLLTWTPGKGQDIPNHPLQALRANATLPHVLADVQKLSTENLRLLDEFLRQIREKK